MCCSVIAGGVRMVMSRVLRGSLGYTQFEGDVSMLELYRAEVRQLAR